MQRTFSLELSEGGTVIIAKIPNLLKPLRGPVVLAQDIPREAVTPAGIHGLIIKDVILLTMEVVMEL